MEKLRKSFRKELCRTLQKVNVLRNSTALPQCIQLICVLVVGIKLIHVMETRAAASKLTGWLMEK